MRSKGICIKTKIIAFRNHEVHHAIPMSIATTPSRLTLSGSPVKPRKNPDAAKPASRRTTVALSKDAIEIVKRFQEATGLSMSDAVSGLIESTEPRPPRI
jgi:hypothetical protein